MKLAERKSRLAFETSDTARERGEHRAVCVEAFPHFAVLRLKGLQHEIRISWTGLYEHAARLEAEVARRDHLMKRRRAA
jgi:hypothetical protein